METFCDEREIGAYSATATLATVSGCDALTRRAGGWRDRAEELS